MDKSIAVLLIVVILLAASFTAVQAAKVYLPLAENNVHSGMATITCRLMTDRVTTVRLAECWEKKVFILDLAFSPGTYSDEDGYFIFEEVEAVDYVIIIGNMRNGFLVITNEAGNARVFTTLKDGTQDVGKLSIKPRNNGGGGNVSRDK